MLSLHAVRLFHLLSNSQPQPDAFEQKPTLSSSLPNLAMPNTTRPLTAATSNSTNSGVKIVNLARASVPVKAALIPSTPAPSISSGSGSSVWSALPSMASTPMTPFSISEKDNTLLTPNRTPSDSIYEKDAALKQQLATPMVETSKTLTAGFIQTPHTPASLPGTGDMQEKEEVEMNHVEEAETARPDYVAHRFEWKNGGSVVKVTGNFDGWEKTIMMKKRLDNQDHFEVTIDLDRSRKILFKFIVDGSWACTHEFGTEYDNVGNLNNVLPAIEA